MSDTEGKEIETNSKSIRRARRLDAGLSIFILFSGLGVVSGQFFERAQRQLLADRCLYPLSSTDDMSSERISEEVTECADFLGWGGAETFLKVMERLSFLGWVVIAVVILLTFGHKRLSLKRFGTTFGRWLDAKIDSRSSAATFPPPTSKTEAGSHEPKASDS